MLQSNDSWKYICTASPYGSNTSDITIENLLSLAKDVETFRPEIDSFLCTHSMWNKIKKISDLADCFESKNKNYFSVSTPIYCFDTMKEVWDKAKELIKQNKRPCVIEEHENDTIYYWKPVFDKGSSDCSWCEL